MDSGEARFTARGAIAVAVTMAFLFAPSAAAATTMANEGRMAAGEGRERLTIVGTRITQGNAVDCPQVRTDDGKVYSVSYLAPSIAIGTRISATGFFANVTHCTGEVLYVENLDLVGER